MIKEEILKNRGIDDVTRHHNYEYLYEQVLEAMEQYKEQEVHESVKLVRDYIMALDMKWDSVHLNGFNALINLILKPNNNE